MKLLLDTHIIIHWFTDPSVLPPRHLSALREAVVRGDELYISSISLWEIAKLFELRRLEIKGAPDRFLHKITGSHEITILQINPAVALESTRLGAPFPRDPADQLIAATARVFGLRLLTMDERIVKSGVVTIF